MIQLMLAAFSGLEIAIVVCVGVLSLALIALSVVILVVKSKNNKADKSEEQTPIIIYQTVHTSAAKQPTEEQPVAAAETTPAPTETETAVADAAEEQTLPVAAEEEAVAAENSMRYNRSFHARLIQAEDSVKEWYGVIKNTVLAYAKVSSRMSWKYESFSYKRNPIAKLFIKGKTLYLYLPLNAADYAETKYKLEDVSEISQFAETPALYKLKSERRVKYAQELLTTVCENLDCKLTDRQPVDYYEPYNSDAVLIKQGLVKRVIEEAGKSFIGASHTSEEAE